MEDYDVVLDTLQKRYDILLGMIERNMTSDTGLGIMDDIRFKQLDQLKQAMDMWKGRK